MLLIYHTVLQPQAAKRTTVFSASGFTRIDVPLTAHREVPVQSPLSDLVLEEKNDIRGGKCLG
jgi:hypothetical protein